MVDPTSNDNDSLRADERQHGPDPHGQAAILLVESLMHGLIARSVISLGEAIEIVGVATDVREQLAPELGGAPAMTDRAHTILSAISASLSIDLPDEETRPWPPRS